MHMKRRTPQTQNMSGNVVRLLISCSFICGALSCFNCFIDVDDRTRLCWGYTVTVNKIRNVGSCFETLDRIFLKNKNVINAGRVGRSYDTALKKILKAQTMPLVEEFDKKTNNDTVYEARLQKVADSFIAMTTGLPRASDCFPPCGFQDLGTVYNCETCQYDSCGFPLDCPLQELTVEQNNRSQMWCKVQFTLPNDTEIVWRYVEVKTVLINQFREVTVGTDVLYSIPSARPEHSGTYQCEIFSRERSLVRIYFHLNVTPQEVIGHVRLQDVFDQALLPDGQFPPAPPRPFNVMQWAGPGLLIVSIIVLLFCIACTACLLVSWGFFKNRGVQNEQEQERRAQEQEEEARGQEQEEGTRAQEQEEETRAQEQEEEARGQEQEEGTRAQEQEEGTRAQEQEEETRAQEQEEETRAQEQEEETRAQEQGQETRAQEQEEETRAQEQEEETRAQEQEEETRAQEQEEETRAQEQGQETRAQEQGEVKEHKKKGRKQEHKKKGRKMSTRRREGKRAQEQGEETRVQEEGEKTSAQEEGKKTSAEEEGEEIKPPTA